ncbi:Uma2 family endonuclease [Candidatus Poribacteria bacterium]|nr:Uma2 family endonuclease [Candidatus Poribacteria bacterium]
MITVSLIGGTSMRAIHTTSDELKKKKITLADYLLMPELNHPYEIIDGKMMPSPAPIPAHQIIGANIFSPLSQYVKAQELGVVLFAPVDIILQRDPLRTRQPDVLFIHKDKLPGTSLDDLEGLQLLEITPDLIVEVLSPSDTKKVLTGKLTDYQRIGVKECWLVSRETRSVEVLRLSAKKSEGADFYGLGEIVHSEVLIDLRLTVDAIFA